MKKEQQIKGPEKVTPTQTIAGVISRLLGGLQNKSAAFIGKKTHHWNQKQKVVFFICVCLAFGGVSIFIMVDTLTSWGQEYKYELVPPSNQIIIPVPEVSHAWIPKISPADTTILHRFHRAVDSLQRTPQGRAQLEEFESNHKGFIDSLLTAEKMLQTPF
ncbi:hypothetical protein PV783_13790 [Chitinophaga sp. CC14]|uniref:hypothetical protein n=1 Tax=Chitinophaga sp. CC14 TaxID=3029199 RepID=UPI003B809700